MSPQATLMKLTALALLLVTATSRRIQPHHRCETADQLLAALNELDKTHLTKHHQYQESFYRLTAGNAGHTSVDCAGTIDMLIKLMGELNPLVWHCRDSRIGELHVDDAYESKLWQVKESLANFIWNIPNLNTVR